MSLSYKAYLLVGVFTVLLSAFVMLRTDNNFTLFLLIGLGMILYGIILGLNRRKRVRVHSFNRRAEVGRALNRASHSQSASLNNQPAIHFCPRCGARVLPGYRFCPRCGAPLS